MAKRRAEIMRNGISKCFQFLVSGLELGCSFSKLFVEGANFLLPPLALSDVIIRFEDGRGPPLLVSAQRPSTRDYHLGSVRFGLLQLAVPTPGAQQFGVNLLDWRRKDCPQKFVSALANRFLYRPTVQLLGSQIPVNDDVAHIP